MGDYAQWLDVATQARALLPAHAAGRLRAPDQPLAVCDACPGLTRPHAWHRLCAHCLSNGHCDSASGKKALSPGMVASSL